MRMVLSVCVVLWHAIVVSGQGEAANAALTGTLWQPLLYFRLPMFFALSGFLICASAQRCQTLLSFGLLRGLRIVPALAVEVAVTGVLLGPMLTNVSLADYFQSDMYRAYLLSGIGWIHYQLPGVFAGNPVPGIVNLSLWTLPVELFCYLLIACALWFRGATARRLLVGLMLIVGGLAVMPVFGAPPAVSPGHLQLILCFLVGASLYIYRKRVVVHAGLALAALVATIALLAMSCHDMALVALPISYLTVYLGLQTPQFLKSLRLGDYSYGIYLYSFPIQQTIVAVFGVHDWWVNAAVSLLLSTLAALASWHLVEKRVIRHKATVLRLEQNLLTFWQSSVEGRQTRVMPPVVPIVIERQGNRRRRLRAPIY